MRNAFTFIVQHQILFSGFMLDNVDDLLLKAVVDFGDLLFYHYVIGFSLLTFEPYGSPC